MLGKSFRAGRPRSKRLPMWLLSFTETKTQRVPIDGPAGAREERAGVRPDRERRRTPLEQPELQQLRGHLRYSSGAPAAQSNAETYCGL